MEKSLYNYCKRGDLKNLILFSKQASLEACLLKSMLEVIVNEGHLNILTYMNCKISLMHMYYDIIYFACCSGQLNIIEYIKF
jgi:hypothetical protein